MLPHKVEPNNDTIVGPYERAKIGVDQPIENRATKQMKMIPRFPQYFQDHEILTRT